MGYKIFFTFLSKSHLYIFRKSDSITTARWSSLKYKNHIYKNTLPIFSKSIQHNFIATCFLKTMHAYFTKDIYIYKMSHFNFYYFYFTPYLIYNHNTVSRTENPEKVFGLQHLHLKNYFKIENCEPNGFSEYYKF